MRSGRRVVRTQLAMRRSLILSRASNGADLLRDRHLWEQDRAMRSCEKFKITAGAPAWGDTKPLDGSSQRLLALLMSPLAAAKTGVFSIFVFFLVLVGGVPAPHRILKGAPFLRLEQFYILRRVPW